MVGEIFFTRLEQARQLGSVSAHSAFVDAATAADWYEVIAFLLVAALVLLLRRQPRQDAMASQRLQSEA